MLRNTFCHIPGIGARLEYSLWSYGIQSWHDLNGRDYPFLSGQRIETVRDCIRQSFVHLEENNPEYFAERLPAGQHWRLFPEFRHLTAYLDIETTGLGERDHITTIALYDGKTISYYVNGYNLEEFCKDIKRYRVIVTYNGKCFDVPQIERYFDIRLDQAHIDLRYVLRSLGFNGGLKGCEKRLGIDRKELDGLDGFFAVLLWEDFRRRKNPQALETLLAYNIQDAVNLEALMVIAYNLKIKTTPFATTNRIPLPPQPTNPFRPHKNTIERILHESYWYWSVRGVYR